MTKRRKQAIILLALSVPMMWWGLSNFMSGTTSNTALAIGTAIGCVFGGFAAISGLVMLATKNSLGIWNPDDKGRGEILHKSQTKVGFSPIQKEIINKPSKKVNEMAKAKDNVDSIKTLDEYNEKMKKLFKREDELKTRKKEVTKLDKEIDNETTEVQDEIRANNWIDKGNGWEIQKK
tara:strand:+ start:500 stop:1033 length:534 start_codon:yes stop_codon:yes gene_type:complete